MVEGLFKRAAGGRRGEAGGDVPVANLLPIVAALPAGAGGTPMPTYRNQLAFIDLFYEGMNNTNFNMAVCGRPGRVKTGLIQPLIRSVLDSGGFARVFDMGDGYKSLCENMGAYTSMAIPSSLNLRSPTRADDAHFDMSAERIRDQMSVMANRTATSMKSMKVCFCRQFQRPQVKQASVIMHALMT